MGEERTRAPLQPCAQHPCTRAVPVPDVLGRVPQRRSVRVALKYSPALGLGACSSVVVEGSAR